MRRKQIEHFSARLDAGDRCWVRGSQERSAQFEIAVGVILQRMPNNRIVTRNAALAPVSFRSAARKGGCHQKQSCKGDESDHVDLQSIWSDTICR